MKRQDVSTLRRSTRLSELAKAATSEASVAASSVAKATSKTKVTKKKSAKKKKPVKQKAPRAVDVAPTLVDDDHLLSLAELGWEPVARSITSAQRGPEPTAQGMEEEKEGEDVRGTDSNTIYLLFTLLPYQFLLLDRWKI